MLWEDEIHDMREALANYLGVPAAEVIYNPNVDKFWTVDAAEFYTSEGVYTVIEDYNIDDAMTAWMDQTISDGGLDDFSPDFQDWMLQHGFDENRLEAQCCDWCYEDAYELSREKSNNDDYPNMLVEYSVDAGLISAFNIIDGDYVGDDGINEMDELIDMFGDYEFKKATDDYHTYANWYSSMFGFDSLSDWAEADPDIVYIDDVVQEFIRRQGYGVLSSYDGAAYEFDEYCAFCEDPNDLRDTLQ